MGGTCHTQVNRVLKTVSQRVSTPHFRCIFQLHFSLKSFLSTWRVLPEEESLLYIPKRSNPGVSSTFSLMPLSMQSSQTLSQERLIPVRSLRSGFGFPCSLMPLPRSALFAPRLLLQEQTIANAASRGCGGAGSRTVGLWDTPAL